MRKPNLHLRQGCHLQEWPQPIVCASTQPCPCILFHTLLPHVLACQSLPPPSQKKSLRQHHPDQIKSNYQHAEISPAASDQLCSKMFARARATWSKQQSITRVSRAHITQADCAAHLPSSTCGSARSGIPARQCSAAEGRRCAVGGGALVVVRGLLRGAEQQLAIRFAPK